MYFLFVDSGKMSVGQGPVLVSGGRRRHVTFEFRCTSDLTFRKIENGVFGGLVLID
jgi:hypothetical protein